ncbi:MAG: radical SAM protein [Geobacter sp.]|nr:radical SAM protein [Geobacter sp.]
MMKVLMLNPPFLPRYSRESRSPAVAKSGTFYYPMWLAYATGVLENAGFEVKLIDAPARGYDLEHVRKEARLFNPHLVVLDTSTPSIVNDIQVLEGLKEDNPDLFTLMVGRHVSALPEETMARSTRIDAVAIGEYDHIVRDLALALRDGLPLSGVRGLLWRDRNTGEVVRNDPMPYIEDLDSLPFVSEVYKRHLLIEDYFYGHSLFPIITMVTGRGCPFKCFYCCYPQTMYGHRLRLRSPENVAAEFRFIAENFPEIKEVMLEDDTLTVNLKHAEAFADALIATGNKIPFSANSRAEITDIGVLKKLRMAGCRLFCVGFESGNQQILDNMKKGLKLERALQFSKATKKAGIMVHGCFMVGNPGETPETLEQTLAYAKELNPDTAQFYPIMVYPGTDAFKWAEESGYLLTRDYSRWVTPEGLHATVLERPELSSRHLMEFCDRARREFYLRPRYIVRKIGQSLLDSAELRRNIKGFVHLLRHLLKRDSSCKC